jgi:hypothetical protein
MMITLAMHQIVKIELLKKDFSNFKIMEFAFIDRDGKKVYVEAFCEINEYPEITQLPEMDLTQDANLPT